MCQTSYANFQSKRKLWVGHEAMRKKPINLTLRAKVLKDHIGFMNIRDTLSHGNTPMCQVWHANVKAKRSHGPDTNLHEQMDGWTDRQNV